MKKILALLILIPLTTIAADEHGGKAMQKKEHAQQASEHAGTADEHGGKAMEKKGQAVKAADHAAPASEHGGQPMKKKAQ